MNNTIENIIHDMFMERIAPIVDAITTLQNQPQAAIDEDQVKDMIEAALDKRPAHKIEVTNWAGAVKKLEGVHPAFETVLNLIEPLPVKDRNIALWGDASSGKSWLSEQVAEALSLPFYFMGMQETKYDFFGVKLPATGEIVDTPLTQAWRHGGVCLLDDIERSGRKALTALNNAFASGKMDLAHLGGSVEPVERHPDCIILATMNSPLTKSNNGMVSENHDKAFKTRFVMLPMNIDEGFELSIAPNVDFAKRVQKIRKAVKTLGGNYQEIEPSMRATIQGGHYLNAGKLSQELVEEVCIFKGISEAMKRTVLENVGKASTKVGGEIKNHD